MQLGLLDASTFVQNFEISESHVVALTDSSASPCPESSDDLIGGPSSSNENGSEDDNCCLGDFLAEFL